MSYLQAYDFRSFNSIGQKDHGTLFQSVFRNRRQLVKPTDEDKTRWNSDDPVLNQFRDHTHLVESVFAGKAMMTVPGRFFNHDMNVVLKWGNLRAKISYCACLFCLVALAAFSIFVTGWIGVAACFFGVMGSSGNGNLIDGLIPQLALGVGLVAAMLGSTTVAFVCAACWLMWLVGSYALALAYEISCDLVYHSASGFYWLYSRGKVIVITRNPQDRVQQHYT
jgi:hypothetical protein